MKDIPAFTTEYGVASLGLSQIQSRGDAFICVQDCQPGCLDALLHECANFCRLAGAQRVFANRGNGDPAYTVLQMHGVITADSDAAEHIFPVTTQTVTRWREIYNRSMADVDHAKYLSSADENKILSSCGAYFIHRDGELLGIGWVEDQKLLAIAACKPGAGYRVLQTLMPLFSEDRVSLEVASTNIRAIRLYERAGLIKTAVLGAWYKIL